MQMLVFVLGFAVACLNPYCIGSSNHAKKTTPEAPKQEVLILIVLDHLIMHHQAVIQKSSKES